MRNRWVVSVKTFSGYKVYNDIQKIWFYNGVPNRIWVKDDDGEYKYKYDEEPFIFLSTW